MIAPAEMILMINSSSSVILFLLLFLDNVDVPFYLLSKELSFIILS